MDVSDSLLYERVNVSMIQPEYSKIKTVWIFYSEMNLLLEIIINDVKHVEVGQNQN